MDPTCRGLMAKSAPITITTTGMKKLPRFTIGMGDRFAHQGEAQLSAVQSAAGRGVPLHPVWNKSNREHTLIGTKPQDLRAEADALVITKSASAPLSGMPVGFNVIFKE